jgi:cysteine desulfurase
MMTISGSKIEGSPKVGMLYKRRNVNLAPLYAGGNQEMGLRPGTEDVEDISLFADALEYTQKIKDKESARLTKLQDYFILKIQNMSKMPIGMPEIIINGDIENRLPNNINITIPNIPSDLLVLELDARGVYVSSKSACKSGDGKASYVIEAIDKNIKQTDGSLRFSFGRDTKKSDIDYVLKSLKEILQKLKKWYS